VLLLPATLGALKAYGVLFVAVFRYSFIL